MKGCDIMQKEMSVKELETTLEVMDDIKNPIIVKRKNKSDVVIISIEDYKNKILESDIIENLKQSEKDIKEGNVESADLMLAELDEKYGNN